MKNLVCIALVALLMAFVPAENPTKIIFFGDSITQAGVKPNGYIDRLNKMIEAKGLAAKYQLIGAGIGGNKVYDLFLRMEEDVLAKKPDVVVLYIGVNDVWHKRSSGTGTDADKFVRFYEAIIKKLQAQNTKLILCTPAVIGEKTDHSNEQDGDLNKYSGLIRDLATKNNIPLCDLRKEFLAYNLKNNPDNKESGILTTDRVHLNDTGNQFVADAMFGLIVKP